MSLQYLNADSTGLYEGAYTCHFFCARGGTRTHDLPLILRRLFLFPVPLFLFQQQFPDQKELIRIRV